MGSPQTLILIAITVVVSWLSFSRTRLLDRLTLWPPAIDRKHEYDRLVTHGFVHADWMHLFFNMFTLYFFGPLAERFYAQAIGPLAFPVFYLAAIVFGVLYLAYSAWADARGGHGNINHSAHFWGAAFGIAAALVVEPQLIEVFTQRLLAPLQ